MNESPTVSDMNFPVYNIICLKKTRFILFKEVFINKYPHYIYNKALINRYLRNIYLYILSVVEIRLPITPTTTTPATVA